MKPDSPTDRNSIFSGWPYPLQPPNPFPVLLTVSPPPRDIIPQSVEEVDDPPGLDAPIYHRCGYPPPLCIVVLNTKRQPRRCLLLRRRNRMGFVSGNTFACTNKMTFVCYGERGGCGNGDLKGSGESFWCMIVTFRFFPPHQKNNL